ncbi:MAG: SRPBCC family protein [Pseudomonadota bacterium]
MNTLSYPAVSMLALLTTPASAFDLTAEDMAALQRGDVLVRTVKSENGRRVEAAIEIENTTAAIWSVMTDCAAAPRFVPNLQRCEVTDSAADGAWEIIEHEVKYSWIAPKTVYRFRADYEAERHIRIERISGDLRRLEGDWRLTPSADDESVIVTYSVNLEPGVPVPGFIVRRALRKDVPAVLEALREQVK